MTHPTVETPPLRPRDSRLAPWRAFVVAHARVWRRLDDDLRLEHNLSLSEYEALLLLAEASGRSLRMRVLAEDLQLSKSGVTRLVDRLVEDGLVERGACTTDARGAEAILTSAGLDRLRTAAPTHLRGIQAYFLDAVPPEDLAQVEEAMTNIADRLPGGPFARAGRMDRTEARCSPAAIPPSTTGSGAMPSGAAPSSAPGAAPPRG